MTFSGQMGALGMHFPFFAFAAFLGGLALLVLVMADREMAAGVERISRYELSHHAALDVDPSLKLVSAHSPYMRNER
jgi:hypothetical protein